MWFFHPGRLVTFMMTASRNADQEPLRLTCVVACVSSPGWAFPPHPPSPSPDFVISTRMNGPASFARFPALFDFFRLSTITENPYGGELMDSFYLVFFLLLRSAVPVSGIAPPSPGIQRHCLPFWVPGTRTLASFPPHLPLDQGVSFRWFPPKEYCSL